MRTLVTAGIGALLVTFVGMSPAHALPQLSGGYAISGNFNWVNNATGLTVPVLTSNALDFETVGNTPTPGVPGEFLVNNSTGDFSSLGGCPPACSPVTIGTIRDFTFVGAGNANYPDLTVPLVSFEVVGGFTFDLIAITSVTPNSSGSLNMEGIGVFHAPGFADTPGEWDFTGQNTRGVFSFSASQAAVPTPEPTTLLLFGAGLVGLGVRARRAAK